MTQTTDPMTPDSVADALRLVFAERDCRDAISEMRTYGEWRAEETTKIRRLETQIAEQRDRLAVAIQTGDRREKDNAESGIKLLTKRLQERQESHANRTRTLIRIYQERLLPASECLRDEPLRVLPEDVAEHLRACLESAPESHAANPPRNAPDPVIR